MNKSRLLGAVCACLLSFATLSVNAALVGKLPATSGGADWQAYYDDQLDITWLADANAAGTTMNWADANAWAAALDVNGITGWRLPTNTPLNGSTYNTVLSTNGTTDRGLATTTTDGTNGGWRDGSGNPVSEMGQMFYVTLGNLGSCYPTLPWCTSQPGSGLSNTGPFSNVLSRLYWSGSELNSSNAWHFDFFNGTQFNGGKVGNLSAWAVRSGDVSAVPVPAAVWLFGSGLIGLLGLARRKR